MLSRPVKNIMFRVIKRRIAEGENLDSILESYPKLSDEDKEELRKEFN